MATDHSAGMTTTRLATSPNAVADRLNDAEYARDYLIRKGHEDLLPVLGLDGAEDTSRRCAAPGCDQLFLPTATGGRQRTCSRGCANRLTAAERQADRNELNARAKRNV